MMHAEDLGRWTHPHRFETGGEAAAERRTRIVVGLTLVMMVIEIAAGVLFPLTGLVLNPMFAALAMSVSSVSVVANALRLRAARI